MSHKTTNYTLRWQIIYRWQRLKYPYSSRSFWFNTQLHWKETNFGFPIVRIINRHLITKYDLGSTRYSAAYLSWLRYFAAATWKESQDVTRDFPNARVSGDYFVFDFGQGRSRISVEINFTWRVLRVNTLSIKPRTKQCYFNPGGVRFCNNDKLQIERSTLQHWNYMSGLKLLSQIPQRESVSRP